LNYQFGGDPAQGSPIVTKTPTAPDPDSLNFHGQFTLVEQAYPAFRSPYQGANSLPGGGQGRETTDLTLSVGVRLWEGAQAWIQPEIDQGHGLEDTHGVAGFTSAESYKIGFTYPYARMQRYFARQTIDLGGETEKVDADFGQFAGSQTANRLVLTFGRFSVVDIFDTNKYANSAKNDFLNWSSVNVGSFDYAGDAWAYTYGVAAEWYQGNWTLRGGLFDTSQTPSGGGGNSALGYGLDPSFSQIEAVGEIEHRYYIYSSKCSSGAENFVGGAIENLGDATRLFGVATALPIKRVLKRMTGSMKLVGCTAVEIADAPKGLTHVIHATANAGQRVQNGIGCGAMGAEMGSAFRCYVIELSRAFLLAPRITDLFKKRQCRIDHAWARAVKAARTFLDRFDKLIAVRRFLFEEN
jgi:high affinity Mn2+ porin